MIQTKKDLAFFIAADRIMNGYPAKRGIINALKESILVGGVNVNNQVFEKIEKIRILQKYTSQVFFNQ